MPQDPNLYGQPPPKKKQKSMPLSTSLDFTSQLTALLSGPSTSSASSSYTTARPRPSKSGNKTDALFSAKAKRKPGAKQPNADADSKLMLKSPTGTEEEKAFLASARRKMEEKARLYAAMKRGDYVPGREGEAEPLVDFDRKWAERQAQGKRSDDESGSEEDEDDNLSSDDDSANTKKKEEEEMVEYEDEFSRLRTSTKSAYAVYLRRLARGTHAAAELESMSARPAAPSEIIYGPGVQAEAFTVADPDKMEELARKRDRSATPPEARHYDAQAEIRNRGTGFYAFSKEEDVRREEMKGLEEERKRTESVRKEREELKEKRRGEVEERRREVERKRREKGEMKAKQMAEDFLGRLEGKWAEKGFVPKMPDGGGGGEAGKEGGGDGTKSGNSGTEMGGAATGTTNGGTETKTGPGSAGTEGLDAGTENGVARSDNVGSG
ncbi:hypothetical protein GE09DRAFT_231527 [Coniochaeta sp. 2T2.1]|nr:hypothetical protein GE09DRAFT_231527 [Coniochaeta sp. 2T2.1]